MPDGTSTLPAFRVTDRAHAQITDIAAREGRPEAGLRLAVEAGGCSGFQYKFGLEDGPAEDDLIVGEGAGRVFVDPVSLDLLAGAELDWAEELIGAHGQFGGRGRSGSPQDETAAGKRADRRTDGRPISSGSCRACRGRPWARRCRLPACR